MKSLLVARFVKCDYFVSLFLFAIITLLFDMAKFMAFIRHNNLNKSCVRVGYVKK